MAPTSLHIRSTRDQKDGRGGAVGSPVRRTSSPLVTPPPEWMEKRKLPGPHATYTGRSGSATAEHKTALMCSREVRPMSVWSLFPQGRADPLRFIGSWVEFGLGDGVA